MDFFYREINAFLLLLLLFLPFSMTGQQSIQQEIDLLLKREGIAGAVYSIVSGDSVSIYSSGYKNLKTKTPMSNEDKVHVGSITKTFLAMGILRLATENRLDLNEPIKKYLKDLPMINPWESTHPVTIRHLLDHTSGLSDIRLWHFLSTDLTPQTPLKAFYGSNPEVLSIHAKPGTLFSYSNIGYTLLGMLVEAIVKEPYETYLDKNLLQPIGLHQSTFHFTSQIQDQQLAMGHFDNGATALAMPTYVRPAGQFTTTAEDMGKFLSFILNGGRLNGKEFIKQAYLVQLGIPKETIAARNGLKSGYALGVLSRERYGVTGLAHPGNTIGFRAMYYLFLKEKKAFFIAHNMDSETADYDAFNLALTHHLNLHNNKIRVQQINNYEIRDMQWDGYYIPVFTKIEPMELIDIIGNYTKVSSTKPGLSIQSFQGKEVRLTSKDGHLFYAPNRHEASHLFYKDKQGTYYLTTGIITLKKINGWKILLLTLSVSLGITASMILLFKFPITIYKRKSNFFKLPLAAGTIALLLFIVSLLFIFRNDVTRIGNRSFSTILLYGASWLLPVGILISLVQYGLTFPKSIRQFNFWIIITIAQFIAVLGSYHLIPFATWN